MKTNKFERGTFIAPKDKPNNIFIIVDIKKKYGNTLFVCVPVINIENKRETDRYIFSLFKNKVVVISRTEQYFSHQVIRKQARMSNTITENMIQKYKQFNPNKEMFKQEKYNIASYDGFRNGNPWQGMDMMKQRPKVYKG